MTMPLSRTTSRTSARLLGRGARLTLAMVMGFSSVGDGGTVESRQVQGQVHVVGDDAEVLDQLVEGVLQLHEGAAQALDLLVGEVAGLDAAQGLALHHLADDLEQGHHEPAQPAADVLAAALEPPRGPGAASPPHLVRGVGEPR